MIVEQRVNDAPIRVTIADVSILYWSLTPDRVLAVRRRRQTIDGREVHWTEDYTNVLRLEVPAWALWPAVLPRTAQSKDAWQEDTAHPTHALYNGSRYGRPVVAIVGQSCCTICHRPLMPADVRIGVTAHFACVVRETLTPDPADPRRI